MKGFAERLFSWKTLRNVAIGGLGAVGAFSLISMVGMLPFVGTALAIGISAVSAIGLIAGAAVMGVAAVAAAGKGLVNLVTRVVKWIQQRNQNPERTKNKNKDKNKDKNKKASEEKEKEAAKGSRKASGMYHVLSDENQQLYDAIIKRESKNLFNTFTYEEIAALKNLYAARVKELKAIVKAGGTLTPEQQEELAWTSAMYVKANNVSKESKVKVEPAELTEEKKTIAKDRALESKPKATSKR